MDTGANPDESSEGAADPATRTAVMPAPQLADSPTVAHTGTEPTEDPLPWPDRAGERLTHEARAVARWGHGLSPDQRGAAGAIAALVVLLVLVGVLSHA